MHARGHILQMSPQCHPELAGEGIEYAWGAAKLYYRRNNDGKASTFHTRVRSSLAIVTRKQAFKFQRRARSYRRALSDTANSTFSQIEKTIKSYKSHRDAGKFDAKFIRESVETD